ncbi:MULTISPECIES: metal-dependent transcriptional regulator [Sphingobacterium]|uniref:metal-dependent transcriptional regulator n=1 Tax=Sphingobacterium TaxID=28453 RepID=UPI0013DC948D|nr:MULTISPECIES: metal-dependent transcriptional regulator [unclassified Sphingobacterium]
MNTPIEENYLKALFMLSATKGEATVNEVSRFLDIKMPTVNSMMKRLADKGFVIHENYKPLKLTDEGRLQAALVIRKHRLTEMYLVEKMGFGWDEVHHIAEQIEHIHAPDFFNKMDELLGYPTVDPHGSPIPNKEGNVAEAPYLKLSECQVGDEVELMAVGQSSSSLLKYLDARELGLGISIRIEDIEDFDKSMHVSYLGRVGVMLTSLVCDSLLVRKG